MYCKKCGKEVDSLSKFCPECGAEQEKAGLTFSFTYGKAVLAVLAVLILVVVIVLAAQSKGVNSSPEKLAAATVESEYEADIDKMVKCFPEFTLREFAEDYGLSENAGPKKIADKIKEDYGNIEPVKVKITDSRLIGNYNKEDCIFPEMYDGMTREVYDS
ncbi:MAG: zinc ribbon domain-containing protein, partial [Clostridia bacterium]|nr:zinc ribbon domain-containing protein [Clostridia bacterium]